MSGGVCPSSWEDEAVTMLSELRRRIPEYPEARFSAEQNALVTKNAEAYYRAMVRGGSASWNVRDRHMAETLDYRVADEGSFRQVQRLQQWVEEQQFEHHDRVQHRTFRPQVDNMRASGA